MSDALIKIALRFTCQNSDQDSSTPPNMIPIPIIIQKAKSYLASSTKILQHEDPDGPESGGLIAGAKQLELSLSQFQLT